MEKILLTRKEAAQALSISVNTLDEIRNQGLLKAVYIGARGYFAPEELRAFVTKEGQIYA